MITCNICGEELEALIHTDTELHPDDAVDGLELHKFNGGIPQDFLDIDADESHWTWGEYDGKPYVIPATETGTDRLSDMTDAMMSEIPGLDDTVQPLKLEENRFYGFAVAYLMQDGNLAVPGGRYGRDTRDCAPVAIAVAYMMQYHNGDPITYYQLNSDMGLVVNSSDDVATLLSRDAYVFEDTGIDIKELLGDAYEPQTPLERLAKWAEVEADDDSVTITFDSLDAERLIDAIRNNETPFEEDN